MKYYDAIIGASYEKIHKTFMQLSGDPKYRSFVVPPSRDPEVGFAIFYSPPIQRPLLLIVGQNPANFAGPVADLRDWPNAQMLSGSCPTVDSYRAHQHSFGRVVTAHLERFPDLAKSYVGMNVWYFQKAARATDAPKDLRALCERESIELLRATDPRAVLCLGKAAFRILTKGARVNSIPGSDAVFANVGGIPFWGIYHPTGSFTRAKGLRDLPVVLEKITEYVGESP